MTDDRRPAPLRLDALDGAVDALLARIDGPLRIAAPLGIGKPHRLLNALYARIAQDPSRPAHLYTALLLDPPTPSGDLQRRFLAPFRQVRPLWMRGDRGPRSCPSTICMSISCIC